MCVCARAFGASGSKCPEEVSVMGAHGWISAHLGVLVCGYLAMFSGVIISQADAGCGERESPNCCTGRNNECFEYTKRKTVCYCDTYCQKTGDCCEDYQRVCQISGELLVLHKVITSRRCLSSHKLSKCKKMFYVSVLPQNMPSSHGLTIYYRTHKV